MALSVKDFYEYGKYEYALTLLTDKAALDRTVSWIYLLEDINNLSFLREGNLVITTCMSMKNPEKELPQFIRDIAARKVSGILINVGRYITGISPDLIACCSENRIPLFTMPWEIHIADLMQYFCNLIISEKRNREQRDYFLFHALTGTQAYRALLTGKIRNTFPCEFRNIGLYNAVFAIQDQSVFEDARNRLSILDDETTRKIFRCYLENGGHIRKIADELYLHRNTVNYHVCKAKDLLHITDEASRLECLFDFYLCDYADLLSR